MGIQEWIAGIAIKKAITSAVKLIISIVTATALTGQLENVGVKIDPIQLYAWLTVLINSGLTILRNFLKIKYGVKWLG